MAGKKKDKKAAPRPEVGEIAAAGGTLDLTGFVGEVMQPGDPLLRSLGGDLKHYELLLRDDQVASTFQQRRRAVISTEWEVLAASDRAEDKAAAEDLEEQLHRVKWDRAVGKMLFGLLYGFAVGECLWAIDANRVVLHDIKVRKARRFRFGKDGALRLLTRDHPQGLVMPERKFWTFNAGADNDDDPYGVGLGYWLYWPVFLKRNAVRFWAIALEKFGIPTTKGSYPPGAKPEDIAKLLEAAQAVATETAVVFPDGMDIQLLEATRRAGGDHDVFCRYWDAAIAKVVLSQTMTTDAGSSRSQAEVHMEVRDDVVKADADLVCESFNDGPARWLTEWNHPRAEPPQVWRIIEQPEDLEAAAKRDKTLHEMGFEPDEEYVRKKYGEGWKKRQAPAPAIGKTTEFAENETDRDAEDDLADQLDAAAAAEMDAMIDTIRAVVEQAATFEEIGARLAEIYPTLDGAGLAEVIGKAMTLAELTGRAEIVDGDD